MLIAPPLADETRKISIGSADAPLIFTGGSPVVSLEYPPLAQHVKIHGSVELRCTIGIAGEVLDCKGIPCCKAQ